MGAVDRCPGEVQGVRATQLGEEDFMQPGPHPCLGPLGQTAPAGHARPEAEFLRQVFPGDPGVQHEEDALEHEPVRIPLASRMPGPTLDLGQQRLDHRPQLVVDFPRLRPSHLTPPDQRSRSDPTTPKIISLGVLRAQGVGYVQPPLPFLAAAGQGQADLARPAGLGSAGRIDRRQGRPRG